jgi:hypothetical protein
MSINNGDHAFVRYAETTSTVAISSGSLTLNLDNGNIFLVSLNANVTSITISNINSSSSVAQSFSIVFTADGTQRTVSWPASVKWPSGSGPTLTSTNGKKDVYHFMTLDGGTTWLAFVGGKNY